MNTLYFYKTALKIWIGEKKLSIAKRIFWKFFSNGKYIGEIKNGLPHGQGKLYYAHGGIYDGDWNESLESYKIKTKLSDCNTISNGYKFKGEIINGQVRRVEYGNVIVDLGRGEAILKRDQLINREPLRINDRVRAIIKEVREETRGPQIFLSRTAPEFLSELFKMEVPEIYDGIIEIRTVARDPGSRAKIGVISHDTSIDPVGACVGMRGSRVQAVVNELQGEKIDIIPWNEDAPTFLVNALQPAEVSKVVLDEDAQRIEVVVPDEQLSLAIGREGQNVRLASKLTNYEIDILTDKED